MTCIPKKSKNSLIRAAAPAIADSLIGEVKEQQASNNENNNNGTSGNGTANGTTLIFDEEKPQALIAKIEKVHPAKRS